jgi:hypothetical protein
VADARRSQVTEHLDHYWFDPRIGHLDRTSPGRPGAKLLAIEAVYTQKKLELAGLRASDREASSTSMAPPMVAPSEGTQLPVDELRQWTHADSPKIPNFGEEIASTFTPRAREAKGASFTETGVDRMTGFSQGRGSTWLARIHQTSQSAGLAAELRTVTVVGGTIPGLQIRPVVIAVSRTGPSGMDERARLNGSAPPAARGGDGHAKVSATASTATMAGAHHFGGPARCDRFTGLF